MESFFSSVQEEGVRVVGRGQGGRIMRIYVYGAGLVRGGRVGRYALATGSG